MTVPAVLYDVVGGGGDGTLDEFIDQVTGPTTAGVTYNLGTSDGLADTVTTPDADTTDNAPTVDEDTPANRGAVILPTLDGWWDAAGYSGSGNFLNSGTMGSAWDLVLGAATAAPSFAAGVFSFDGVNDYMSIADADSLDPSAISSSYTIGLIMTPVTAITTGTYMISKSNGEASALGYHLRVSTSAPYFYHNDNATAVASLHATNLVVGTKRVVAGIFNRRDPMVINSFQNIAGVPTLGPNGTVTSRAALNTALPFTVGARADLTGFIKMDVVGIIFAKRVLSLIDLQAIAAYYGV